MKTYSRALNESYPIKLNSLVVNSPYTFDSYSTSPKIAKLLSLPWGVRIESTSLLALAAKGFLTLTLSMLLSSIFIIAISLPIQGQNNYLSQNTKKLTNEKFELMFNLQATTSFNKLFSKANKLSMKDGEETIYISNQQGSRLSKEFTFHKKQPYIQFSGF